MLNTIEEKGKVDRLKSLDDIRERYKNVDELYNKIASTGGLSSRSELIQGNFREEGGILIHLGPDGIPFFGKKGHHRLAVALALELEYVPAQLGVVHVSAIKSLATFHRQVLE